MRFLLSHSKAFSFFGLFGLIFLAWAWVDSVFRRTSFTVERSNRAIGFEQQHGYLVVSFSHRWPSAGHSGPSEVGWNFVSARETVAPADSRFSAVPTGFNVIPELRHEEFRGGWNGSFYVTQNSDSECLVMPHWLPVTIVSLFWLSMIAWRYRKSVASNPGSS